MVLGLLDDPSLQTRHPTATVASAATPTTTAVTMARDPVDVVGRGPSRCRTRRGRRARSRWRWQPGAVGSRAGRRASSDAIGIGSAGTQPPLRERDADQRAGEDRCEAAREAEGRRSECSDQHCDDEAPGAARTRGRGRCGEGRWRRSVRDSSSSSRSFVVANCSGVGRLPQRRNAPNAMATPMMTASSPAPRFMLMPITVRREIEYVNTLIETR